MNKEINIEGVLLKTDRMILRPWEEGDLDDLLAYASVDGVGQMAGLKPLKTKEEAAETLRFFWRQNLPLLWSIRERLSGP